MVFQSVCPTAAIAASTCDAVNSIGAKSVFNNFNEVIPAAFKRASSVREPLPMLVNARMSALLVRPTLTPKAGTPGAVTV